MNISLEQAYHQAIQFASSHYENFPVVSVFLPRPLRKHVAVVYQFSRQADNIADEGSEHQSSRLAKLDLYEKSLNNSLNGKYENDFWKALHNTIQQFNLTPKHFFDLLSAFKQDVVKSRYLNFEEVLNYCQRSANPIGRIILEFFNIRDEESVQYSDAICTALQLTNFYQDISLDIKKNRIYMPQDELKKIGVELNQFELKKNNTNFEMLLKFQVERTKLLFKEGYKLIPFLPASLKRQIKMTILGGEKIIRKIEKINYDVLSIRPKLSVKDYCSILLRSLIV